MRLFGAILCNLRFSTQLIHLMMQCVKMASFSVLVNGVPNGPIVPIRGLCQEDLLSTYLFLLCIDGLVKLFEQSTINGGLRGFWVCWRTPTINYLLFVDNSLIFFKANRSKFEELLTILKKYAPSLGQCINTDKTTIVFNKNDKEVEMREIMALLDTRGSQPFERYLGLPHKVERSRKRVFSNVERATFDPRREIDLFESSCTSHPNFHNELF